MSRVWEEGGGLKLLTVILDVFYFTLLLQPPAHGGGTSLPYKWYHKCARLFFPGLCYLRVHASCISSVRSTLKAKRGGVCERVRARMYMYKILPQFLNYTYYSFLIWGIEQLMVNSLGQCKHPICPGRAALPLPSLQRLQ